jgi:hypothetical protein
MHKELLVSKKEVLVQPMWRCMRNLLSSCTDERVGAVGKVTVQLFVWCIVGAVSEDARMESLLMIVCEESASACEWSSADNVEDFLKLYEVTGYVKTPAAVDLFSVDLGSARLAAEVAELFHSRVIEPLYLVKRVRPEILTAVNFLTSRVNCSTRQDWNKLDRVLRYLNKYPKLGMGLRVGKELSVMGYIDALLGVHDDNKFYTGSIVSLGAGPVVCDSLRQKTTAKSSYEAELMAATDGSNSLFYVRNLLLEQGHVVGPAKLYQDNQSALASVKTGKPSSKRSRHINIRYFYLKDKVDHGELEL